MHSLATVCAASLPTLVPPKTLACIATPQQEVNLHSNSALFLPQTSAEASFSDLLHESRKQHSQKECYYLMKKSSELQVHKYYQQDVL